MSSKKMNNPGTELYPLNPNSVVKLIIRIGFGQPFVSSIFIDNIPFLTDKSSPTGIITIDLPGNGQTLNGKYVKCYTHVTDKNPNTDQTSVSYEFKGGQKNINFEQSETASPSGSVVFFWGDFLLYI